MTTETATETDWWAAAANVACLPTLTPASRLLFVVMCLEAAAVEGEPVATERQWAARAGMTPHQARQAIAALRAAGIVERGWRYPDGQRPSPIYRPLIEWPEAQVTA